MYLNLNVWKKKLLNNKKLSFSGLLITLGIIYGDIGTSPLYVMQAIVGKSTYQTENSFWVLYPAYFGH
jgi:K+ transporter